MKKLIKKMNKTKITAIVWILSVLLFYAVGWEITATVLGMYFILFLKFVSAKG